MTIGIGFCYGPCSTCSTTYGYLSRNVCRCSCHHASVSISSTTSGLVLSTEPQQLIYSAITDVDICGQHTQVVAGRTTAVFRSIHRCSCREREQLCDIERETGKRGQDKHTHRGF